VPAVVIVTELSLSTEQDPGRVTLATLYTPGITSTLFEVLLLASLATENVAGDVGPLNVSDQPFCELPFLRILNATDTVAFGHTCTLIVGLAPETVSVPVYAW
jgi:hypothetical protein